MAHAVGFRRLRGTVVPKPADCRDSRLFPDHSQIAAALTRHVAERAATEGATTLHLYTTSAQSYWERGGWYRVGDEPYLGEAVTVMALDLSRG